MSDRDAMRHWAQQLLADDFVILDTETTGLGIFDQVVQIAVIDKTGAPLLDTMVKPTRAISRSASAIHGITDEMVKDAPTFGDIYNYLLMAIGGKRVLIYNKNFDVEMLHQSEMLYHDECDRSWVAIGRDGWQGLAVWEDVMIPYSDWVGEWSDYHGNNRWQKLPGGDHTALGDARACLAVICKMAGELNASITVRATDDELRGYATHHGGFYPPDRTWGDDRVVKTPIEDALSAFVADLAFAYSDRAKNRKRIDLAHAWLDQWQRDLGWVPIFEQKKKASEE